MRAALPVSTVATVTVAFKEYNIATLGSIGDYVYSPSTVWYTAGTTNTVVTYNNPWVIIPGVSGPSREPYMQKDGDGFTLWMKGRPVRIL